MLIDVAGQRSTRKKWLKLFSKVSRRNTPSLPLVAIVSANVQDVDAIIYVAALSDYDTSVVEEPEKNKLEGKLARLNALTELSVSIQRLCCAVRGCGSVGDHPPAIPGWP